MSDVVHTVIPSGKNTSAILESVLKMKPQCMFNQAVRFGIITDDITQDGAKGNSMTIRVLTWNLNTFVPSLSLIISSKRKTGSKVLSNYFVMPQKSYP